MTEQTRQAEVPRAQGDPDVDWSAPHYGRVLAAVDDSSSARFALRHAVAGSIRQRSHLTIVTVVPNAPATVIAAGFSPERLEAETEARMTARVRDAVASFPAGLSVTTVARHGDPADEILALLDEQPFDLLCMGARGRGRMVGALLGSVSTEVLKRSSVPVVVWHQPG